MAASFATGTRACRLQRGRAGFKERGPASKRLPLRVCYDPRMPSPKSSKQSFSKAKRLTQTAEFTAVKFQGKTYRGSLLILGVLAQKEEKAFRAGFVTPNWHRRRGARSHRVRRLPSRHRPDANRRGCYRGFGSLSWRVPYAANASHQQLKDEWLRLAERASILAP